MNLQPMSLLEDRDVGNEHNDVRLELEDNQDFLIVDNVKQRHTRAVVIILAILIVSFFKTHTHTFINAFSDCSCACFNYYYRRYCNII
jgi:hypothetical protein